MRTTSTPDIKMLRPMGRLRVTRAPTPVTLRVRTLTGIPPFRVPIHRDCVWWLAQFHQVWRRVAAEAVVAALLLFGQEADGMETPSRAARWHCRRPRSWYAVAQATAIAPLGSAAPRRFPGISRSSSRVAGSSHFAWPPSTAMSASRRSAGRWGPVRRRRLHRIFRTHRVAAR